MVHLYREQPVKRNRLGDLAGCAFLAVFMLPLVFGIAHGLRHGFTGDDAGGIVFGLLFGFAVAWAVYDHSRRSCFEIRLTDEGMCEFVTGRRVIRLHVHEITAVEYTNDDESGESYTVRHKGGRIGIRSSISDLRGFATRLRAMNPAVDLSSFPDFRPQPVKVRAIRRLAARCALPLALIGVLGVVLCVLVMAGLVTGLLPEHFIWLFPVGMVAAGGLVVALNAFSPEQAHELARDLGDKRLPNEIERRSFGTSPARWKESQRARRKPLRRLLRAVPLLLVASIGVLFIVGIHRAEPGNLYPRTKDAVSEHEFTQPLLTETSGVWLVPLGEPRRVDITQLAVELAARYRIPVAALPDIALPSWTLDAKRHSLVGDQLIRLLGQAYRARGRVAIIGITDYEMYGGTDFQDSSFSWRESPPGHYAVVSTSLLGDDTFDLRHRTTRHIRTRKLVARDLGFLYYRRPERDDSRSLLRPSMNGVHEIDALREEL
jgi:hypothetical protein